MRNGLLIVTALIAVLCTTSCQDKIEPETGVQENKLSINGTYYDIIRRTHVAFADGEDASIFCHQFMIQNPQVHINIMLTDRNIGKKINLKTDTGKETDWRFTCSGNGESGPSVNIGGNSIYTDDFAAGSWLKVERAGSGFNVSFEVINSSKTTTLKAVIKGGFEEMNP